MGAALSVIWSCNPSLDGRHGNEVAFEPGEVAVYSAARIALSYQCALWYEVTGHPVRFTSCLSSELYRVCRLTYSFLTSTQSISAGMKCPEDVNGVASFGRFKPAAEFWLH